MNGKSISVVRHFAGIGRREGRLQGQQGAWQANPTFVRLDPGVTAAQLLKAAAGDPNDIALVASVVFSPQANKGTSWAEVSLKPGNYVAVDLNASQSNPPVTTFTISRSSSPASSPKTQSDAELDRVRLPWRVHPARRRARAVRQPRVPRAHDVRRPGREQGAGASDRRAAEGGQGRQGPGSWRTETTCALRPPHPRPVGAADRQSAGRVTGSSPASCRPRMAANTPGSAWNGSSTSSGNDGQRSGLAADRGARLPVPAEGLDRQAWLRLARCQACPTRHSAGAVGFAPRG